MKNAGGLKRKEKRFHEKSFAIGFHNCNNAVHYINRNVQHYSKCGNNCFGHLWKQFDLDFG